MSINNATELRNELAENFTALKNKELGVKEANAMSKIAHSMISAAVAQLRMAENNGTTANVAFLKEPEPVNPETEANEAINKAKGTKATT